MHLLSLPLSLVIVFLAIGVSCLAQAETKAPAPLPPVPTPQQLAWQLTERNLFVHFGINTFTGREWGEGKEDPKLFNPEKFDARQWVRAAKDGGFSIVILTAKHHDGFCLWPSRYTDHSVKSSPWKNGKGDVVRELANACRAEGLKLGLYLSPWDRHEATYGDSPKYNDYYVNQLTELLTQYGPVAEVWFDGACGEGPNGKKQVYDWPRFIGTVRKLQPDAVMFGADGGDVRWIGNESGTAGDPCWAPFTPGAPVPEEWAKEEFGALQHGYPDGQIWWPGESDVSIRPGWFYHAEEDAKVRSVDNLVDLYFKSVGRNSLLLLNVPPTRDGLFHENDAKRLAEFNAALKALFAKDLARNAKMTAESVRGRDEAFGPARAADGKADTYWCTDDGVTKGWLEAAFDKPARVGVVSISEQIALGQRVQAYRVDAWCDGAWKMVAKGRTIGCKRLERFEPVETDKVRLVIEQAKACPTIAEFGVYSAGR